MTVHEDDTPLFAPLTAEHEAKIDELLRLARAKYDPVSPTLARFPQVCDEAAPTLRNNTRLWAHAFLVARQWDVARALAMLDVVHAYRARQKLDEFVVLPSAYTVRGYDEDAMREELQLPQRPRGRIDRVCAAVDAHFSSSIHYWDKDGLPVQYLCVGTVDEHGLLKTLKRLADVGQSPADVLWEYVQHCISIGELLGLYQQLRIRRGDLAAEGITDHNGLVRAMTLVVDARGLNYTMLWKPALDLFKEILHRVFTYNPDCVHRFIVVNCPRMILFAYSIVKNVFTPEMQRKVSFYKPDETPAALARIIARKHVPAALGGECACTKGCFSELKSKAAAGAPTSASSSNGSNVSYNGSSSNSSSGSSSSHGHTTRHANDDEDDNGDVYTEDVALRPGKACVKAFVLARGEKVVWEYATEHAKDIQFALYFVPQHKLPAAASASSTLSSSAAAAATTRHGNDSSSTSDHAKGNADDKDNSHGGGNNSSSSTSNSSSSHHAHRSRTSQHDAVAGLTATALERGYKSCLQRSGMQPRHADTFTAQEDGALALVWNNTGTWLRSRTLQLRVYKESADDDDGDEDDENNVHAVVRRRATDKVEGNGSDNNNDNNDDARTQTTTTTTTTLASARSSASGHDAQLHPA